MTDLDALCARLFELFEAHDLDGVEQMLADGATVTQNGNSMDWPEAKTLIRGLMDVLGDYRYEHPRRVVGDHAVVEEHDVVATTASGDPLRLTACVVVRVDDEGAITSIDEYVDPAPLAAAG